MTPHSENHSGNVNENVVTTNTKPLPKGLSENPYYTNYLIQELELGLFQIIKYKQEHKKSLQGLQPVFTKRQVEKMLEWKKEETLAWVREALENEIDKHYKKDCLNEKDSCDHLLALAVFVQELEE